MVIDPHRGNEMNIKQLLSAMVLIFGCAVFATSALALNPQPLPPGLKSPYVQGTGKYFPPNPIKLDKTSPPLWGNQPAATGAGAGKVQFDKHKDW